MNKQPEGLLHAKLLDGRGGAKDLAWSEVTSWHPNQGCLWLHLDFEDSDTQAWIERGSGLNDIAADGLLTAETRPRTLSRGDHLLMSLRGIDPNPGSEPDDMVSVRIWTDGQRLISTRRRALQATRDLQNSLQEGHGPRDAATLLVAWVNGVTERIGATVDAFEDQIDDLDERILTASATDLRQEIGHLRKQTIVVRRYLAPQREAMNRLFSEPVSWLDELNRLRLREVTDRLIRHIEDIDAVRERAAVARDELEGRIAEQLNARSYVFTVVATIFLPLGFFTGLMGINVGGMPGVNNEAGFWIVAGACLGITVTLGTLFRWRKWM